MKYESTDSAQTLLVKVARNKMHEGIARITFRKVDGSFRTALATTSDAIIKTQTKTGRYLYDDNVTPFYDIEIGRWRSFRNSRLLSVESVTGSI